MWEEGLVVSRGHEVELRARVIARPGGRWHGIEKAPGRGGDLELCSRHPEVGRVVRGDGRGSAGEEGGNGMN